MSRRLSCHRCGSLRVQHCVEYGDAGEAETAWFQCASCGLQFSDFKLSDEMLAKFLSQTKPVSDPENKRAPARSRGDEKGG